MKETIEALSTFAATVKNNKFGACVTILLVILLMVGLGMVANTNNRVNHVSPTPQMEAARFIRANRATEQINTLLDSKLQELNADRAGVRQFHNGKTDLAGLPFNFVSTMYVRTKQGVGFPVENYQQVPASTISEITSTMWHDYRNPVCITVDTATVKTQSYRRYLEDLDVDVFYACPITNIEMYPIGFVFLTYKGTTDRPSDEEVIAKVSDTAQRISGYLSAVTKTDRQWWQFWKPKYEDRAQPVSDPVIE